jgi:hypothetical protein
MMIATEPLSDLVAEGARVVSMANDAGVPIRLTGGVGIAQCCPSASSEPLKRTYADIDIVGRSRERRAIRDLVTELGYKPDAEFNAVHGARRLLFWDSSNARQLDVFLDRYEMCHTIDLRERLELCQMTLTPADLLLTKLTVVEATRKRSGRCHHPLN